MLGRWAPLYDGMTKRRPYGSYSPTYTAAAEWLRPCRTVEDWGSGGGWFVRFLNPEQRYIAVDGTANRFVDRVADLATYRPVTKPEGILCRHVLEHCTSWKTIIANLLESFTKRAVIVVYTPFTTGWTHDLGDDESGLGVPTLSFNWGEFLAQHDQFGTYEMFTGPHCGHYGMETVFRLERRD